jgi:predicted membrane protein
MDRNRINGRFVLGLILLCIGVSIVFELLFGISLPILRVLLAVVLLVIGVRLIQQTRGHRVLGAPTGEAWLADRQFVPEGALDHDARYDISFGRGVVDLTRVAEPATDVTVSVHTLFGSSEIRLDPTIAYDVEGHAALGEVRMPDKSRTAMGGLSYRGRADHPPRLHLRVDAVFGACRIVEATTQPVAAQLS